MEPQPKLLKIHFHLTRVDTMKLDVDVTYRLTNMFSPEKFGRFYFSCTTHFKTVRYYLANYVIGKTFTYM